MSKIAISCLVDASPKFAMQAWNWLSSLESLGTKIRADLFIHHTPSVPRRYLDAFSKRGARLVEIEPFGTGAAAYSNKIRQLDTTDLRNYDYTIISDADLVFLACPSRLASGSAIKAKLVDMPCPPEEIWRKLLNEAGLGDRVRGGSLQLVPDAKTFSTNFNGGLYVLPQALIAELAKSWAKWARYCLQREELLGNWLLHSDQLGFGMAVLEGSWAVEQLPIAENFPSHFEPAVYDALEEIPISALHYHFKLDTHGLIVPTQVAWIDKQISAANKMLIEGRRRNFDNSIFWDFRYETAPELGSGVGSRGDVRREKDSYLRPVIRAISRDKVLDVGCGDLQVMKTMPFTDYRGIDISAGAIELSREERPDWKFENINISEVEDDACDWAICLDVLIHQSSADDFNALLSNLVRVCRKGMLVTGYADTKPNTGIVFTHQSMREALGGYDCILDVMEIGSYRDVTLFLALKAPAMPTSRWDASIKDLAFGCSDIAEWPLLLDLVEMSRERLGFFPKTITRTIEYPWFARRINSRMRSRVLDIGAGVAALPLWLSNNGHDVVTVDSSQKLRNPLDKAGWNEWGYLDYSLLDKRISSHNIDAQHFEPEDSFDSVYSVSVLEHMPAELRRAIIGKIPNWLAPGGRLYLSLDLTPGTYDLWPLNEGKQVDPKGQHGTLQDIISEIQKAGLRIVELAEHRGIPGSRTDLVFIDAVFPPVNYKNDNVRVGGMVERRTSTSRLLRKVQKAIRRKLDSKNV